MGRVTGFTGRVFSRGADPKLPKYFNSPETPLYNKSKNAVRIGYGPQEHQGKNSFCYLVEGNPDAIKLHSIAIHNTVAPCGTALTAEQIEILKPLVKSVNIIGDTDKAGKKSHGNEAPSC